MVSPAANYGLLLNSDPTKNADRYRYFASMENPNVSQRPVLLITYTVPAAAGATSTPGAGAAAPPIEPTVVIVDPVDQFVARVAEPGDQQVRGDFDGDGSADAAKFRPSTAEWRVWLSSDGFAGALPIVWGAPDDLPVAADYDGDHKTDLAVYRPATGMWHVLLSSTNRLTTLDVQWGNGHDWPVAFDYDGDGKADLALPSAGGYDILLSGSGYTASVRVN